MGSGIHAIFIWKNRDIKSDKTRVANIFFWVSLSGWLKFRQTEIQTSTHIDRHIFQQQKKKERKSEVDFDQVKPKSWLSSSEFFFHFHFKRKFIHSFIPSIVSFENCGNVNFNEFIHSSSNVAIAIEALTKKQMTLQFSICGSPIAID